MTDDKRAIALLEGFLLAYWLIYDVEEISPTMGEHGEGKAWDVLAEVAAGKTTIAYDPAELVRAVDLEPEQEAKVWAKANAVVLRHREIAKAVVQTYKKVKTGEIDLYP